MSKVLETLMQRFLDMERYKNDIRYVKYCITYVSLTPTGRSSACVFVFMNIDVNTSCICVTPRIEQNLNLGIEPSTFWNTSE